MQNKKKDADVIAIRFAGSTQQEIIEKTKSLSLKLGVVHSELLRNLIAIGLAAYEKGAIIGFDGKVILPFSDSSIKDTESSNEETNLKKEESIFLS